MLNEETGVRLPTSVHERMQKERTTRGIVSRALVATRLLLRVNVNANFFCRSGFTCKCQLKEKPPSFPFQPINLSSLKDEGATFSLINC